MAKPRSEPSAPRCGGAPPPLPRNLPPLPEQATFLPARQTAPPRTFLPARQTALLRSGAAPGRAQRRLPLSWLSRIRRGSRGFTGGRGLGWEPLLGGHWQTLRDTQHWAHSIGGRGGHGLRTHFGGMFMRDAYLCSRKTRCDQS